MIRLPRAVGMAFALAVFALALLLPAAPASGGRILHVWKQSPLPNPDEPYASKDTAAHTINKAMTKAKKGDKVFVHGECKGKDENAGKLVQCVYPENVVVPCGVELNGKVDETRDKGKYWYPIIDGRKRDSVIRGKGGCRADDPSDRVSIIHFVVRNGKAKLGGGIRFENTPVSIVDNCIVGNRARNGGGIALFWKDNKFVPSFVSENLIGDLGEANKNIADGLGGGIFLVGEYDPSRDKLGKYHVRLRRNRIVNNAAVHPERTAGGGLSVTNARVEAEENLFEWNRVRSGPDEWAYGGAVYVRNSHFRFASPSAQGEEEAKKRPREAGQYASRRNVYRHNSSSHAGGAWAAVAWTSLSFEDDRFEDNAAGRAGGVGYLSFNSSAQVRKSHLLNTSEERLAGLVSKGGGIYASCGAELEVERSRLENLEVTGRKGSSDVDGGGGVYARNSRVRIQENVITGNRAYAASDNSYGGSFGGGFLGVEIDERDRGKAGLEVFGNFERYAAICNQPPQFSLQGNYIERNSADQGGGVAILLLGKHTTAAKPADASHAFEDTVRPTVQGNVIGFNRGGGVYYKEVDSVAASSNGDVRFYRKDMARIEENLIDRNEMGSHGVKIVEENRGVAWMSEPLHVATYYGIDRLGLGKVLGKISNHPAISVRRNRIFRNEGAGIRLERSVATQIVENRIVGNGESQILLEGPIFLPEIRNNQIDGAGKGEGGILIRGYSEGLTSEIGVLRIHDNNIVNHASQAALNEPAVKARKGWIPMAKNWWGNASGPPREGANSTEGGIEWEPPLKKPAVLASFDPPRLPRPAEPNPRVPPHLDCYHVEEEEKDGPGRLPPEEALLLPGGKKSGKKEGGGTVPRVPGGESPGEEEEKERREKEEAEEKERAERLEGLRRVREGLGRTPRRPVYVPLPEAEEDLPSRAREDALRRRLTLPPPPIKEKEPDDTSKPPGDQPCQPSGQQPCQPSGRQPCQPAGRQPCQPAQQSSRPAQQPSRPPAKAPAQSTKAETKVRVPDLVGIHVREAKKLCSPLGLHCATSGGIGTVGYVKTDDAKRHCFVAKQNRPPGTLLGRSEAKNPGVFLSLYRYKDWSC